MSYIEPSVDRDANPAWSPDGKQIAFTRSGTGQPWSIHVATVSDGTGRQIWHAEAGPGSSWHPLVAEHQITWGDGDRILFPWEKDGWLHLYSVAVEGGPAKLLTPGKFEVEHVAVAENGKEAVFSSNQDDIDRRHIWRVSMAGGPPTAVTKGESLQWSPVFAGDKIAYLHADARRPAQPAIQIGSEVRDLAPGSVPPEFPADSLVVPQQVIYSSSDGMQIHGQLFLPPRTQSAQKHHAIVFLHGGPRRAGCSWGWRTAAGLLPTSIPYAMNQYLANQGYVVLAINYRTGIGYGAVVREAANARARREPANIMTSKGPGCICGRARMWIARISACGAVLTADT